MVVVGLVVTAWVAPAIGVRATKGGNTTGDEPHYLLTALSLFEDRNLDVADERARLAYLDFYQSSLALQERVRDDGSAVSPHDPLLPVILAVPMGLGGWVAAKLTLAVMAGGLAAALVWLATRRFGAPLAVSVLTVLTFSLAAPLAFYGTQVYPELPAALATTVAIGALTGRLARGGLATLAVAAVALPWLSVKFVPVAAALVVVGLVKLWRRGDRGPALVLTAVLVAAGVVYVFAHQLLYEGWTVYASGNHFSAGETTVIGRDPDYWGRARRLSGLLTDRGFGLAAGQPAFLLAVPALAALGRARPPGWAVLAAPLAAGWLNATFVARTMHGWWFPGRQVVVVLPCAVLAVAWWAGRRARVRPWLAGGAVVGAATVAWLTVEGLLGRRLVTGFQGTTNPFHRVWRLLLPDDRLVPSGTVGLRAFWYVALALLALWGWRSLAPRAHGAAGAPISEPDQQREAQLCEPVPS